MTTETEYERIKSFLDGNENAFREIVNIYRSTIYWQARRMVGNHLDADEIAQEVILVLHKKLSTFKFNSALSTWIYRITSNMTINYLRKKNLKRLVFLSDSDSGNIRDEGLYEDYENREKLKLLDGLLQRLPKRQREVFIFRNFENLSYEEISQITGKSIGGLKASYHLALKKVLEYFDENN